jgi:hypothetical protein
MREALVVVERHTVSSSPEGMSPAAYLTILIFFHCFWRIGGVGVKGAVTWHAESPPPGGDFLADDVVTQAVIRGAPIAPLCGPAGYGRWEGS